MLRLSKQDAATHLRKSPATINRMIERGELNIEKEPQGSRYKVWVLLDDESPDTSPVVSHDTSEDTSGDISLLLEVTQLRERVKSLEELADYHRQQLTDAEWRYQEAMRQLAAAQQVNQNLTAALPPAQENSKRRRWWPFG